MLLDSVYFGVLLTLGAYAIGMMLKAQTRLEHSQSTSCCYNPDYCLSCHNGDSIRKL